MQDGSVTVERRKRGPDVWCFRWREGGPDGRRIHRRIVLGTADDLKSIASARKAVVGLRREINVNDIRIRRESITLADLSRHFQQRELVRGNTRIAYSTRKAYEGYLRKWIEPRWGEYRLFEIRAVEVESWLKSLNRARNVLQNTECNEPVVQSRPPSLDPGKPRRGQSEQDFRFRRCDLARRSGPVDEVVAVDSRDVLRGDGNVLGIGIAAE
jgi:hypothetical protein